MRVELIYMQYNISEILILEMASLDTLCVNRHFGVNSLYNLILLIWLRKANFSVQNNNNNNNNNSNNNNSSYVQWYSKPGFVLSLFLNFLKE